MISIESPGLLNRSDKEKIDHYVKDKVCPRSLYGDRLISKVENGVGEIVKKWFSIIQERAKNNFFSWQVSMLDQSASEIVTDIMIREYKLTARTQWMPKSLAADNYFDQYSFFRAPLSEITFEWSRQNRHLYKFYKSNIIADHKLFNDALRGEGTDLILKSKDGEEVFVHSSCLSKSEYFKSMLEGSFKESNSDTITLPFTTVSLNNLHQFLYMGTIRPESHKNIEELLDLLKIGHMIHDHLFNHCRDLILLFLDDRLDDSYIAEIITTAFMYGTDEFLIPCLQIAEEIEETDPVNCIDLDQISTKHYATLLSLAARNDLVKIERKLILAIDQKLNS